MPDDPQTDLCRPQSIVSFKRPVRNIKEVWCVEDVETVTRLVNDPDAPRLITLTTSRGFHPHPFVMQVAPDNVAAIEEYR